MYIVGISHCCESRMSIHLIFVMLHARKTLCNVTKAHGAYMYEVDCIDHQTFLSARLRWVSAMGLCGVSQIGFAAGGGETNVALDGTSLCGTLGDTFLHQLRLVVGSSDQT